jgi:hypothetical protein
MIAPLIELIFLVESGELLEFKTGPLNATKDPLAAILSAPPALWTPTTKMKVVAGITLGFRFAHCLWPLHGRLKASNVLFDAEH